MNVTIWVDTFLCLRKSRNALIEVFSSVTQKNTTAENEEEEGEKDFFLWGTLYFMQNSTFAYAVL